MKYRIVMRGGGKTMKLNDLTKNAGVISVYGSDEKEIKEVVCDSNSVTKGSLYICLKGRDYDGCGFIRQVENYGAAAIVTESRIETSLTQVIVKDARKAMSIIAANFYRHADKKLRIIGVTGTNGKTTTAHFLASVLVNSGVKCGIIGTLGTFYADKYIEPTLTTPDPLVLHKTFYDMAESGVEAVVIEVSAHAIYLEKTYGIKFETVIFTNFSQDHLDYFGNMEDYKRAKLKLFEEYDYKYAVINSDDAVGREIIGKTDKAISYGIENPADVFAIDVNEDRDGQNFVINLFDCIYNVTINLIGEFNVYNALAAATAAALYGVTPREVADGLENLKGVGGRLEKVYEGKFDVYIDYAHTPDGLKNALLALGKICENRLICVFGCGGNRDEKKRPIMGKISGELADFTVITSDNPRFEEPMDIIWQIEKGVLQSTRDYVIVQDRAEGIEYAVNYARDGDVILIAGKGHEKYQEVFGIKHLYNDKDTVEEIIKKCKT